MVDFVHIYAIIITATIPFWMSKASRNTFHNVIFLILEQYQEKLQAEWDENEMLYTALAHKMLPT